MPPSYGWRMTEAWQARASSFLETHGGDAAAVVVAMLIGGAAADATDVAASAWAGGNDIVGLAASVAVWWRRRATVAVAAFTFVAAAIAPLASGAAVVGVFALAAHRCGRPPAALLALYVASAVCGAWLFPDQMGTAPSLLLGAAITAASFGWGVVVRKRRELHDVAVERARDIERARIAAEMHDVLGHRLSLLSLHAGAIEVRPDAPPDQLARSAAVVRETAHAALEELRAVIDVMGDDEGGLLGPRPTFTDLDTLVDECRRAGMAITSTIDVSEPAAVPPAVGRDTHRLVREGLTNARTHAPGAPVELSVTGGRGAGLRVVLTNPLTPRGRQRGGGLGLVGLRERIERAGGTIEHGIDERGRHRLDAWLPWPP